MAAAAEHRPARLAAVVLTVVALVAAGALLAGFTRPGPPAEPALLPVIDASSGDVSAFPAPGTPVASRHTHISLRGVTRGELGTVHVVGSKSGTMAGTVLGHSDGDGVSFVPERPFHAGEQVHVRTDHDVRGADDGSYSFTVAVPGARPDVAIPPVREAAEGEEVLQLLSAPHLQPPVVRTLTSSPDATTELVSVGVKNGFLQKGPMLVDAAGDLVWFHPLRGVDARDVKVQSYRGEPVLTWWEGRQGPGFGFGEAVIVDDTYTEVARVAMGNGYAADSHEVLLTPDDTLLLIAYETVAMDTSGVGGPVDGQVVDNVVQEVDIDTGAVLFEWHSVGTVALEESYESAAGSPRFDYVHANSVDVDDDGNLLVSARHTCTVYKLDRTTGSIIWRLGGRASDFSMGPGTRFLKQHDARRSDDGTITLFDNGGTCGQTTREVSRGLALKVDEEAMSAELAREFEHPDGLFSASQANFQELQDGHVFLGWGSLPRWTEMGPDGQLLLDMVIPEATSITSYRAFAVDWRALPATDIDAVVRTRLGGGTAVHVSWNGATEVAAWRVLAQRDTGPPLEVGADVREGFETTVDLDAAALPANGIHGLTVQALDRHGQVLGSSPVDSWAGLLPGRVLQRWNDSASR